ncbi:XRE family transcriptional regulator [Ralstonia nicotianae]|uniref:XRE family transcriptional regulator n=1 Tax=Ralstonia pseudosolanacearum TaxID=1310165 RepID=UPI001F1EDE36|nr:XRE family transcriptional regulator [Ralstonia solanacearum]
MKSARLVLAENLARFMALSADLNSANLLSKKAKVAQTTISNWLRVEEMPSLAPQLSALESVARALGVTVGDLLTEAGQDRDRDEVVRLRVELAASRSRAERVSLQLYELAALLGDDGADGAAAPKRVAFSDPDMASPDDYLLAGGPLHGASDASARRKK